MRRIVSILFLLLVAVYLVGPILDPDLWWHITVGNWIWAHKEIPSIEIWNRFAVGKPWKAYSWMSEVLFYGVDHQFGVAGLLALKWIATFLLACSLAFSFYRVSARGVWSVLVAALVLAACSQNLTLRPQLIVWCIYPLVLYLGVLARQGQLLPMHLGMLVVLFAFWSNNHLTAIVGIGSLIALLPWMTSPRQALLAVGCAILGTLITPYLGGEWATLLSTSGHPVEFTQIAEFQPANIFQWGPAFFLMLSSLLAALLHYHPRGLPLLSLLGGLGLGLGGLAFVKFLPFAAMYVGFLLCWLLSSDMRNFGNLGEGLERFSALLLRVPRDGLAFVCLSLAVVYGAQTFRSPLQTSYIPQASLDYVLEQQLPAPYLCEFGVGGYLMYRLREPDGTIRELVPIDGRTNVMPHEIWEQYVAATEGSPTWAQLITTVRPNTVLWRKTRPLTSLLLAGGKWCEVFLPHPPQASVGVYVRRATVEASPDQFPGARCGDLGAP